MKNKKIINIIMLIIILLSAVLPTFRTVVNAETYTVQYLGKVKYGESTVGNFRINGRQAFCTDHKKGSPPSGTVVESELYNNDNIVKTLYYGWGGAEPFNFTSEAQGIVYTSLALDHYKNGSTNNTAKDFVNYIDSMPVPQITLNFSENLLTAYLTENNEQRTQSVYVSGDSKYYLTIQLQENVTLVNETRGTQETGSVNVYGGDTFYLKAPITVNGSWTSNNIENHKYKFQPILYRSNRADYQTLASEYQPVVDPTSTINLTVNWTSKGNLIIHKIDADDDSVNISDTTFDVFDSSNNLVGTITTNEEGIGRLDNINLRNI